MGIKEGCIIRPTLFAVIIAAELHLTGQELPQGILIQCRSDGRLFNLNIVQSQVKNQKTLEWNFTTKMTTPLHHTQEKNSRAFCRPFFLECYNFCGIWVVKVDKTIPGNVNYCPSLLSFQS